jgi:hypothetical protein
VRLDTYVHLARDLGYCDEETYAALTRNIEDICDFIELPAKPKLTLAQ